MVPRRERRLGAPSSGHYHLPVTLSLPGFLFRTLGISQNMLLSPNQLGDRKADGFGFEQRRSLARHQLGPL